MDATSHITLHLNRLRDNVAHWRALLSEHATRPTPGSHGASQPAGAAICAVIKADAYGLGARRIAACLAQAGVDMLCVYSPQQAAELLADDAVPSHVKVLALQATLAPEPAEELQRAITRGRLHMGVDCIEQLPVLAELAARSSKGHGGVGGAGAIGAPGGSKPLPVHLHLDTGMARGGLNAQQFGEAIEAITSGALPHLRLAGVHTHFATAREDVGFMDRQLARFDHTLEAHRDRLPEDTLIHVASTLPTRRGHRYHRQMVRIGLGLYGYGTEIADAATHGNTAPRDTGPLITPPPNAPPLRPILEWRSRLIHVQRYPQGTPVGYGCSHYLQRDSVVGLIPVGYGDGYPIALSNLAVVELLDENDRVIGTAPVIGKVSMDQITVDLTRLAEPTDGQPPAGAAAVNAHAGMAVRLISPQHNSPCALHRLATLAGTSNYEMLCRLSPRVPRVGMQQPSPALESDALVGEVFGNDSEQRTDRSGQAFPTSSLG